MASLLTIRAAGIIIIGEPKTTGTGEGMAEKRRRVFWPVLSAVLIVGLAVMIVLYVQMLVFINRLVGMVVDLVEREVLAEAPEGVDKAKIKETFEKEGRGIFLPYEEFLELWRAAQPKPPEPEPDEPPADAPFTPDQ